MAIGLPDQAAVEADWAARVRGNREQVDRLREVTDPTDFYAPITDLFRDDPTRTDDPVLNRLLALADPADAWLDIGAGAGRYALPLARKVREVVAIDPSPGMLSTLATEMDHWRIANVRSVLGRWPESMAESTPSDVPGGDTARERPPEADVALMAHVGYDIDAIGPFVDAMERAAGRRCVAVLMERSPASVGDAFWPPVHGEARVALPALPEFLALLLARGTLFEVTLTLRAPRRWASRADLAQFLRRGMWLAPDGAKARRLDALLEERPLGADGSIVVDRGLRIGIVSWEPRRVSTT